MKEQIMICTADKNGTLSFVDQKKFTVILDESRMVLTVTHNKQVYDVQGNYQFQYIVIRSSK